MPARAEIGDVRERQAGPFKKVAEGRWKRWARGSEGELATQGRTREQASRSSESDKPAIKWPEDVSKLPDKESQPAATKEELFEKAKVAQVEFEEGMGAYAKSTGATYHGDIKSPDDFKDAVERAGETDKPAIIVAPIKGAERSEEKVRADYDGDWSQLRDVVRGTIAVNSVEEANRVMADFKGIEPPPGGLSFASKPKDRISKPTDAGYRDLMAHVRMSNGVLAEIQIHLKPLLHAKEVGGGHKYYEEARSIRAAHPSGNYPSETAARLRELTQKSESLYGEAWKKVSGE